MRHYNIPVFVPHMGCPHDCVFCSQRTITGENSHMTAQKAKGIIDEYLAKTTPLGYVEIAFFGGSFTGIDEPLRKSLLEVAHSYIKSGVADGIRVSTRPDYIDEYVLDELKRFGVTSIELGVQSLDDEVLRRSGRGHNVECVQAAVRLIKKYGFELGLQMMTGLPGDTYEKSVATAQKFTKLKPDTVRVYPTLVIYNTALYDMMLSGDYKPWSVESTVELLKEIKQIFDSSGIRIIRMGLQTTEDINPGASVAAGPFHSAMGELVESSIFYDRIIKLLEEHTEDTVYVSCSKRDVSKVLGHKGCNRDKLYLNYKKKLKVLPSDDLPDGELRLLR